MSKPENTDGLYESEHSHEQEEASGEHRHLHEEDCCHEHENHHEEDCHCGHEHHHDDSCHCGHEHHHEDGCHCGHDHEHGGDEEEMKEMKIRLIISGGLFLLFLFLEHILKLPFMENRLINTLLYLIPYLIVGWDVIREAIESLLHGEIIGEQFLMVLASFGAFITGENAEAAAVMILYCLGELLQDYAVYRSRASIRELMDLTPEYANLVAGEDGTYQQVDPEELSVGDTIVILPGEKIPVDGTVLDGESMLDTSSMTGESVPRHVHKEDPVISGCINGNGKLTVRVDKEYRDSTAAKVMELTEEASERKSTTENFVAKFAKVYTPAVVIAALILAVIPPLVTGDAFLDWFTRACTFLVISCPCALVISIPLGFFGGLGAASKYGVLVKGSNFLEAMARIKIFASDKTGTLTKGEFRVSKVFLPDGKEFLFPASSEQENSPAEMDAAVKELLVLAAAAEYYSDHPIALSVREAVTCCLTDQETVPVPEQSEYRSGYGMIVSLGGSQILAGNERLMQEFDIDFQPVKEAGTYIYLAKDGEYLGLILIADTIKPEAADALAQMKKEGVKTTVLLTGDTEETAQYVKEALNLNEVRSELLPQDKVVCVEEYLSRLSGNEKLAYAGDGVNDAPVLARADIGIAMGSLGSDAAIEAADVVIMDDSILKIPTTIRIAKKTLSICRQNIVFILLVKLSFLILGAFGIASMWMAVFADVGVAFLCILNSMRMLLYRDRE